MNEFTLSIVLIVLSGVFQGTFGLGMRRFAPLAWEAFWLIFAVGGMIVAPCIWASLTIPDFIAAILAVPAGTLFLALFLGACWGVGAMMFGLAVNYLGMSLAYGVTMGLAASIGSLVPLVQKGNVTLDRPTLFILLGNLVMVMGVAIVTYAGISRDRLQAVRGEKIAGIQTGRLFWLGLFFCVFNGVAAALLNVGFTLAEPAAKAAIAQGIDFTAEAQRSLVRNASMVKWVIVFAGGVLINVGYVSYLLIKNKSYTTYRSKGAGKGYFWALVTAVIWFLALAFYGQGAALMGRLGEVIGWAMFLALSLVVSNAWGIAGGEWKNVPRPLAVMLLGNAVLVVSAIILGYANSLQ